MGALGRHGTRDDASQTVPDQMDLFPGIVERSFNVVVQAPLDEQIRTVCIQPDSRKVWPIANAAEPRMQLGEIGVGPQKARHQNNGRAVATGYAKAIVNRRRVQQ